MGIPPVTVPVPSVGRIVHFVLPALQQLRPHCEGDHRPAVIVRVWSENDPDSAVQLQVFLDGRNDQEDFDGKLLWVTSSRHDEIEKLPGSWHWPEFVPNFIPNIPENAEYHDRI